MKLNKAQVRLILLLDLVLIVLIVAIGVQFALGGRSFYTAGNEPQANADDVLPAPNPATEYSAVRSARLSLSDSIDLETNVGGSDDERLTDVIAANDRVYVFGNTSSGDYDASGGSGAFVSILDLDLKTLAFVRPSALNLEGVTIAEGGFLLALGGENGVALALIDADGEIKSTAPATDGEFAALRLTDDGYILVTSVTHSPLAKKKLLLRTFDFSLNMTCERMISSPYSLEFVDVFKVGDTFTVFFNAVSDLSRHAGAAVCTAAKSEPEIHYVDKGGSYRAAAVAPASQGWAIAMIYEGGDGAVMLLDGDFNKKSVVFQGSSRPLSAMLDYCDGTYYVGFFGGEVPLSLAYDPTFTVRKSLSLLGGFSRVTDYISGTGWGLFAGVYDGTPGVVGSRDSCFLRFGSENETNVKLACCGDRFFAAAESRGVSADVGGSFGGTDIWIARLKI